MSLYKKHVFVCAVGKTCSEQGSQAVFDALKSNIVERGLKDSIRINKAGCLGQCGNGPMIVVYPEGTWYAGVQASDCQEIIESDLLANQPVKRLIYHPENSCTKDATSAQKPCC